MKNNKKKELLQLDNDEFKNKAMSFSQQEKDKLLYWVIEELWPCEKFNILLEQGANPKQFIGEEKIMLWTIAFSSDRKTEQKELYLSLMIPYLFNNFTDEFKEGTKLIEKNALNKYKVIMNRSDIAYNSVGYESDKIAKKLDEEYSNILNDFENNVEQLNKNSLENEIKTKRSKIKLVK